MYSYGQIKATTKLTFYVIFIDFDNFKMKVSLVTRYPYLWHNITVTDDVNLKNSFLCYLLGDDFSSDLIFNFDLQ
jgi:hypothetical protein